MEQPRLIHGSGLALVDTRRSQTDIEVFGEYSG
jgi:hypothetical protein